MKSLVKIFLISSFIAVNISCNMEGGSDANNSGAQLNSKNNTVNNKRQELPPAQYVSWIENRENGLFTEKKIDKIKFSLLYKPYEYIVLKENRNLNMNKDSLHSKVEEINQMQYFTFRITAENENTELLKVGLTSNDAYYARVEYFSFKMQDDIKLLDGKDTLNCALFHFERIFGLAPYSTFVLGFPLNKDEMAAQQHNIEVVNNDKVFVFDDKVFNSGIIKLNIKAESLNNIPQLKLI